MAFQAEDPVSIQISTRLYALLVKAYPSTFRREYSHHLAQVFRDCCIETFRQTGNRGFFRLWAWTVFDWFRSVVRENLNAETDPSRQKFIRLSGIALIAAAVTLIAGFGFGGGETSYDDPLGGFDAIYEYGQLFLIPMAWLLFAFGMAGLRLRYGRFSGWLGRAGLEIGTVCGVLSFLSGIGLYLLLGETWVGPWWYWMIYSAVGMLIGLSAFGIAALQTRPLARWNMLPLFTAIWFPLITLASPIIEGLEGETTGFVDLAVVAALVFLAAGSIGLGLVLYQDPVIHGHESSFNG